jgi:hypothetical protein
MSWLDDSLPLPGARPVEGEEVLEVAIHALAALAAGIAAMQVLMAAVLGEAVPTAFFSALLVATGACAFVGDGSRRRRAVYLAGGSAAALVWLTLLFDASDPPVAVVLFMAGIAAAITRQLVVRDARERRDPIQVGIGSTPSFDATWIEEDREGRLAA